MNTAENFGELSKRCKLQVNYKKAREKPEEFGVCMLIIISKCQGNITTENFTVTIM